MYNGDHNSTWSIMSTVHEADKNNVKIKSYSYGELNCDGLHILITFIYAHPYAYHYSTAYILHPHIAMISPCWHGLPLVCKKNKERNNSMFYLKTMI